MGERLFDDVGEADGPDRTSWPDRSLRSLSDELRRRKRRLERRNPLEDRAAYLAAFRVVADLEAHLRDRRDDGRGEDP